MKNNYTLNSLKRVCKQKIEIYEKLTEKSSLLVLIDYFSIFKALIILFLLFACMNYVPNQNGKVLAETLAGFNSDAVKTTFMRLCYSKMTLPLLQVFQKSFPIPLSLCHTQYITNGSVNVTFKLVGCHFRALGLV